MWRPLLLASVLPESARGIDPFRVEIAFLLLVALATTVTVPVVGTTLIFSLMIGPPAAARAFTARPGRALALSVAIAVVAVWAAIALSFETNWPVGFFVGAAAAVAYAAGRLYGSAIRTGRRRRYRAGRD
jgi:zinc/manganese transport system permease protein